MGDFGLAVLFSFLAAFGFASGYTLVRVGTNSRKVHVVQNAEADTEGNS